MNVFSHTKLLLPVALISCLLIAGPGFAGTITVDINDPACITGNGQADPYSIVYCSIHDAVFDAVDGDTVMIAAGNYPVASTIVIEDAGLTLQGPMIDVDPRPSSLSPRSPGSANEAIIDGQGMLENVIQIVADGVVINGLEVKSGTGDVIKQELYFQTTVISYCIIHDASGDEGIQLKNCQDCAIQYNYIYDTAVGDAISYAYSSNSIVEYNEMHNIGSEHGAMYIYDSTNIEISNNILHSVSHASKGHGIRYGRGGHGNTGGMILNNIIHDVTGAGICLEDTFGPGLIQGNEIYNVALGPSTWAGIRFEENSGGFEVASNAIYNNPIGVNITDYAGAPDATTITLHDNHIYANAVGALNSGTGILMAENNWWGDASGPYNELGVVEVPPCTEDSTTEMNMDGIGNSAGENIDYCPWIEDPGPVCINDGDVDNSGTLTPQDAQMAFQIYLDTFPNPTPEEICSADCTGDAIVSPGDGLCIYKHYANGDCDCADPVTPVKSL